MENRWLTLGQLNHALNDPAPVFPMDYNEESMSKAAELKVNILRSNEGITLEMLALETLYGNQFTSYQLLLITFSVDNIKLSCYNIFS